MIKGPQIHPICFVPLQTIHLVTHVWIWIKILTYTDIETDTDIAIETDAQIPVWIQTDMETNHDPPSTIRSIQHTFQNSCS